jgi:hypothetical protein
LSTRPASCAYKISASCGTDRRCAGLRPMSFRAACLPTTMYRSQREAPRLRSWRHRWKSGSARRAPILSRGSRQSEDEPSASRVACSGAHAYRQDICILRRATLVSSLRTCTLIAPPAAIAASARSALVASSDAMWTRTLVSKKLTGIRLVSVELEIGRQAATESAKTLQ